MNLDFAEKIQQAELSAAELIRNAEAKARSLTEAARRNQLSSLENARNEADNQRRDYLGKAEAELRNKFTQQHHEVVRQDLSASQIQKAAQHLAERIVSYLGNR